MQRKSIMAIILYIFIGNCALLAQNNSLLEIKLEEFNDLLMGGGRKEFSVTINQNNK